MYLRSMGNGDESAKSESGFFEKGMDSPGYFVPELFMTNPSPRAVSIPEYFGYE